VQKFSSEITYNHPLIYYSFKSAQKFKKIKFIKLTDFFLNSHIIDTF